MFVAWTLFLRNAECQQRFVLHDKQKQMQDIGTSQDTSIVFSEMRAAQQVWPTLCFSSVAALLKPVLRQLKTGKKRPSWPKEQGSSLGTWVQKKKIWLSPAVLLCWTGFVSQQLIIYMYWNTCLSSVDYGKKWMAFKYSLKHQSGPEGVINGMKSSWRQASNKGLIQGVSCGFSPF